MSGSTGPVRQSWTGGAALPPGQGGLRADLLRASGSLAGVTVDPNARIPKAPLPVPPSQPGEPEAIFVVGVPRSGTSLMRLVLAKHPRIALADENSFMGHFLPWADASFDFRASADLSSDEGVRALVDRVYSERFQRGTWLREPSPFWRWLARNVPKAELERRILDGERTDRGLFIAVMRAWSDRKGKPIFGEKTPAHYRHVDTLLDWFPDGRVVHMIRDPRAVHLSEVRRRLAHPGSTPYRWLARFPLAMRGFVLLQVTWLWSDAVHRHRHYLRRHPDRYRLVRFEDLVTEPGPEVMRLCEFLGVSFHERMLRQEVVSLGDRLGEPGFDADAARRWRSRISPMESSLFRWLLGRRLGEMGYPKE